MLKIDHFAQACESYDRAIEGLRVYHALCADYDWKRAEAVRETLLLYFESSLDDLSHAYRLRELSE